MSDEENVCHAYRVELPSDDYYFDTLEEARQFVQEKLKKYFLPSKIKIYEFWEKEFPLE